MEAFYQESGRAGRDQLPSRSLLYFGVDDRRKMVDYLTSSEITYWVFKYTLISFLNYIINILQEFILGKAANKKSHSSSLEEGSPKKSLAEFHKVNICIYLE